MTERDLPTIADLAGAIPDAAPSVGQEIATLRAERDSLLRQIETWQEVHAQDVARSNRFYADLAACRERLAAILDARDQRTVHEACNAARDWLAARAAEGGQDG